MKWNIRLLYLYLFSFVGLLIVVIGSIQIVDLGLKVFVFKNADTYEYARPLMKEEGIIYDEEEQKQIQERETMRNRQRQLSNSLAMIVVGVPLYWYHWKTIGKEKK